MKECFIRSQDTSKLLFQPASRSRCLEIELAVLPRLTYISFTLIRLLSSTESTLEGTKNLHIFCVNLTRKKTG